MLNTLLKKIFFFLFVILRGISNRMIDKNEISPRLFSNKMLRKYAPLFNGNIINVSGWDDRDREGGHYKDYFKNANDYYISNGPVKDKGTSSATNIPNTLEIDLEKDLPDDLVGRFDVVFNHTTLEHIFDVQRAFSSICKLSKDTVILVVPMMQNLHIVESYGDYWRMTPISIAKMFLKNNFTPIVIDSNDQPFAPIYCFAIAVKDVKKYEEKINSVLNYNFGKYLYGTGVKEEYIDNLIKR